MRLPLKVGLPLLGALVIGLAFVEGREYLLLLVAAMAVALWTAFSLPHPGPRTPEVDDAESLVARSVPGGEPAAGTGDAPDEEAADADAPAEGPRDPPRLN